MSDTLPDGKLAKLDLAQWFQNSWYDIVIRRHDCWMCSCRCLQICKYIVLYHISSRICGAACRGEVVFTRIFTDRQHLDITGCEGLSAFRTTLTFHRLRTGHSRGCGKVEYASVEQAEEAVNKLNGKALPEPRSSSCTVHFVPILCSHASSDLELAECRCLSHSSVVSRCQTWISPLWPILPRGLSLSRLSLRQALGGQAVTVEPMASERRPPVRDPDIDEVRAHVILELRISKGYPKIKTNKSEFTWFLGSIGEKSPRCQSRKARFLWEVWRLKWMKVGSACCSFNLIHLGLSFCFSPRGFAGIGF